MTPARLRLGVNIDHVATIRNARGGDHPDPVRAAFAAAAAGADGITAHLREDRRHITDEDIDRLMARARHPAEPRNGGDRGDARDRARATARTPPASSPRSARSGPPRAASTPPASTIISLIIVDRLGAAPTSASACSSSPIRRQIEAAIRLGAPVVEFHTGRYAHVEGEERAAELSRIADAAALAAKNGIEPHAGHGLTFDNVAPIAAIPQLAELNIGHFLVGEAIFTGFEASVAGCAR